MPSPAASRITSTGKCFSSSQRSACGAIFSAANSRAISRTAIWSSLRAKCILGCSFLSSLRGARDKIAKQFCAEATKQSILPFRGKMDCFAALAMTAWATPSIHRRNRELRTFLDAGRPARGHRLGLGIEADRIRAMLVEIAEAGLLPAAKRVVGDRHWDRHVDADHADIDLGGEITRGVAVAGEDGDTVAIVMI